MVDVTGPTLERPKHAISLTDGVTTLGLNMVSVGRDGEYEIVRDTGNFPLDYYPLERQSIKTFTGQSNYDSYNWPYMTETQVDWSGGRGMATFEDDRSRFFDSRSMNTNFGGKLFLGPAGQFCLGNRNALTLGQPIGIEFGSLYGALRYSAGHATTVGGFAADKAWIIVRKVGSPGTLTLELHADTAGEPAAAVLKSKTLTANGVSPIVSEMVKFDWTTTQALGATTKYHIVIYGASTDDASNHWEVGMRDDQEPGHEGTDGSTWAASVNAPWFRVVDADVTGTAKFFKYKGGFYALAIFDDGRASDVYINGDRGAADSNTGALSTLVDATKGAVWTANQYANAIVTIVNGPGSEEDIPFRTIESNTTTALTVTVPWNIEHTTETQYVIGNTPYWRKILDLGYAATDVAVAGEIVYFAYGDSTTNNVIQHYAAYNNAGVWTDNAPENDVVKARHLTAYRDPSDGNFYVFGSQNNHSVYGVCVWKGQVPQTWGSLFNDLGTIVSTSKPWDGAVFVNVTQGTSNNDTYIQVAAGFATGDIAEEDLAIAMDVTAGKKIGVSIKSSVATLAADMDWELDDGVNVLSVDIQALSANTWTWAVSNFTPVDVAAAIYSSIDKVRLTLATDNGAQNITMHGGLHLLSEDLVYIDFPNDARINRLIPYAGSDTAQLNPWVITEDHIYEIQTQAGDAVVPIPLEEFYTLSGPETGKATAVNDVYLWLNMGPLLERYYGRVLEDVGPNRDEGLPSNRKGIPSAIVSYAGAVFVAIDGGDNYSTIFERRGSAWNELYRAPEIGQRIRAMGFSNAPGTTVGKLWFIQGGDLMWIDISPNPEQETAYAYTHEGHLITGYLYANMSALKKLVKKITLFTEAASAHYPIYVDYRVDNTSTWTEVSSIFYDSNTSSNIAASPVSCNRIQLRFRFYTDESFVSPILKSWALDLFGINDTKYGYNYTVMLADEAMDITGVDLDHDLAFGGYALVETAWAQLTTWITAGTPLTQNSMFSLADNKVVSLQPASGKPLKITLKVPTNEGEKKVLEAWVIQIVAYEI